MCVCHTFHFSDYIFAESMNFSVSRTRFLYAVLYCYCYYTGVSLSLSLPFLPLSHSLLHSACITSFRLISFTLCCDVVSYMWKCLQQRTIQWLNYVLLFYVFVSFVCLSVVRFVYNCLASLYHHHHHHPTLIPIQICVCACVCVC